MQGMIVKYFNRASYRRDIIRETKNVLNQEERLRGSLSEKMAKFSQYRTVRVCEYLNNEYRFDYC